ncbi:protein kinase domain-containing protein [Yersinia enterocolitica]|uniref:protein kinase domain-containing protein n=1 Tax=Yersinia enterocolitica TaxID=630 RepID=UPI003D00DACE
MSNHIFDPNELLLDRYKILNYHSAGGMQEVYKCHDIKLDRIVALKTPKVGVKDRRFKRGAEMGARINHNNIAATFDYYEDEKITFLVEEFVDGVDLSYKLSSYFFYLDPSLATHVIHHLTKALYEAHKSGICHRDLKPSNIMVSDDPGLTYIKLTDFGIAKLAESEIAHEMELFEEDQSTLTSSNTLLGAVPYMAPECWDDWKGAGKAMDVWSLGCILYELLSGHPPFGKGRGAISNVLKFQHGKFEIDKPKQFGRHKDLELLENSLWELINECLTCDPEDRVDINFVLEKLDTLPYSSTLRREGKIQTVGVPYKNTGFIDDDDGQNSRFFHLSEFYGDREPTAGQKVSFSIYPGNPSPRCSPILLIKS